MKQRLYVCMLNQFVKLIMLGTNRLSFVSNCLYLGHLFHNTLKDDMDIKRQIRSLYCKANTIARKFSSCSKHVKKYLFKMYCSNIYCASLWSNIMKIHIKRLILLTITA